MKHIPLSIFLVIINATLALELFALDLTPAPPETSGEANRNVLNSERIRQKYGSYGIDVLEDDGHIRVSSLYSLDGEQKITRTLAVVIYPATISPLILKEHTEISGGGSIGEVFKSNGWNITKENIYIGEIETSTDFDGLYSSMGENEPVSLAIHVYELFVSKNRDRFRYATIAEVHHPDYLDMDELKGIYLVPAPLPNDRAGEIEVTLDATAAAMAAYQ